MAGDPTNVRVGPGWLWLAPIGSLEPADLIADFSPEWTQIGYTQEGSNFVFDDTWEDVDVAEELEPIDVLQTARRITVNFAAAEMTAENLEYAFNGGTVTTSSGLTTFEPPELGDVTRVMLGWEHADGLERWIFRRCTQIGSVDIARRKAPAKATIPMSFRAVKPESATSFKVYFDSNYDSSSS